MRLYASLIKSNKHFQLNKYILKDLKVSQKDNNKRILK